QRVEHACCRPAEVDLARGHVPHDPLLGVGGVVTPGAFDLDANVVAGALSDLRHKVFDQGGDVQVAGGVGPPQHDRRPGAAGLVTPAPATAAAPRRDGGD